MRSHCARLLSACRTDLSIENIYGTREFDVGTRDSLGSSSRSEGRTAGAEDSTSPPIVISWRSPVLRHLDIHGCLFRVNNETWDAIADMVEARASLPGCARFENFDVNRWLNQAPLEKKIRLLHALLPSVKELSNFRWNTAFESCFCDMQPPSLTNLELRVDEGCLIVFSWKALEAAPALQSIRIRDWFRIARASIGGLKSVATALCHGALQNLQEVDFIYVRLEEDDVVDFADALEHSGCAKGFVSLRFLGCNISAEGVRALAAPLRRGAFPALKYLTFSDGDIGDECVVVLANALLNATETRLWELNLNRVGMGDAGVVALASVVSQGHFEELKYFCFGRNSDVTDQGMTALARAIDAQGLPMLELITIDGLDRLTDIGVGAIMDALIKRCPQLARIAWGPPENDLVRNKLQEAGRGNVEVKVPEICS